MNTLTVFNIFT